jgi:hypothetical protein
MELAVNSFHFGMSVSAYGSIRVPRVGSISLRSARASVVHRRNEVRLPPAQANKASTSEALHARRVCSFTMSRHQLGVRRPHPSSTDRTLSAKAIPERCHSRSPAQPTVILDSTDRMVRSCAYLPACHLRFFYPYQVHENLDKRFALIASPGLETGFRLDKPSLLS